MIISRLFSIASQDYRFNRGSSMAVLLSVDCENQSTLFRNA